MVKLNGFTNLNNTEKVELKTIIIGKRDDFGDAVVAWQTSLKTEMDKVASHDAVDGDGLDDGLEEQL